MSWHKCWVLLGLGIVAWAVLCGEPRRSDIRPYSGKAVLEALRAARSIRVKSAVFPSDGGTAIVSLVVDEKRRAVVILHNPIDEEANDPFAFAIEEIGTLNDSEMSPNQAGAMIAMLRQKVTPKGWEEEAGIDCIVQWLERRKAMSKAEWRKRRGRQKRCQERMALSGW